MRHVVDMLFFKKLSGIQKVVSIILLRKRCLVFIASINNHPCFEGKLWRVSFIIFFLHSNVYKTSCNSFFVLNFLLFHMYLKFILNVANDYNYINILKITHVTRNIKLHFLNNLRINKTSSWKWKETKNSIIKIKTEWKVSKLNFP